jgi:hypothetical protein
LKIRLHDHGNHLYIGGDLAFETSGTGQACTVRKADEKRLQAAEMKFMRKTAVLHFRTTKEMKTF